MNLHRIRCSLFCLIIGLSFRVIFSVTIAEIIANLSKNCDTIDSYSADANIRYHI